MAIPELFFKDSEGIIEWHKKHYPESYSTYLAIKENFKQLKLRGFTQLLKNLDNNKSVTGFLSYLSELNIANQLLVKQVSNLEYEPKSVPGVDFTFNNIALSVKNLHSKDYEKKEQAQIDDLQKAGGGSTRLSHKNFSNVTLEVKKTEMGTYGWERVETGHSGVLDSDIDEMSSPLKYLGEFETYEVGDRKKVMFFFIQSDDFVQDHIRDIAMWYFDERNREYRPIFSNDLSWYMKLFKQEEKKCNIDAIVFMLAPGTLLSWPEGCLNQAVGNRERRQVYSSDKELHAELRALFSKVRLKTNPFVSHQYF